MVPLMWFLRKSMLDSFLFMSKNEFKDNAQKLNEPKVSTHFFIVQEEPYKNASFTEYLPFSKTFNLFHCNNSFAIMQQRE